MLQVMFSCRVLSFCRCPHRKVYAVSIRASETALSFLTGSRYLSQIQMKILSPDTKRKERRKLNMIFSEVEGIKERDPWRNDDSKCQQQHSHGSFEILFKCHICHTVPINPPTSKNHHHFFVIDHYWVQSNKLQEFNSWNLWVGLTSAQSK